MKKIIAFFVWLAVLAGLIFYIASHAEELKKILHLSVTDISLLALLFIITQVLNSLRTMFLVEKVGIRLGIWEYFSLTNINTMINYLPLKGGLFAVAFYFKNKHDLSYTKFANIIIASQFLLILTTTFGASFFILLYYIIAGVFLGRLFLVFSLLFISTLSIMLLLMRFVKNTAVTTESIWDRIKKAMSGMGDILTDRGLLLKLSCVNFAVILIMGARFAVSFKMLSFKAPLILSFLSGQGKMVGTLLSIVPSGLGIAELFSGGITEIMHSGVNIGVYAASVDRIISVLVLIILGTVSFGYLYKHKRF